MPKLVIANFKMHAPDPKKWSSFKSPKGAEVIVCPAFPFLAEWKSKNFKLGAQDVFYENKRSGGAYTGEVSADMLRSLGAEYVIVGHSERRRLGDTDRIVNLKLKTAISSGLKVVLCVGESKDIRSRGKAQAEKFIRGQVQTAMAGVKKSVLPKIVIAYEPIWAIGTGVAAHPADAERMAAFIRSILPVRVLYGGSVSSANAESFLGAKGIDGALVGGASLDKSEFQKIASVGSRKK